MAELALTQLANDQNDPRPRTRLRRTLEDFRTMLTLPRVDIDLMYSEARHNDPFFQQLVLELYASTRRRHRRIPLFRQNTLGIPLACLTKSFDEYFMTIEAAGRRNVKKARRLGYRFTQINFNEYLVDIAEIRRSTDTRQGPMSEEFLKAEVQPCTDPPSTSPTHGWPYFGVLKGEKLVAYGGCFVCGEICNLEHIYGHSGYQSDGVVPMLIVGIVQHLIETCPNVRYLWYSNYFGASITMRRFQRKFLFLPHKVNWVLG